MAKKVAAKPSLPANPARVAYLQLRAKRARRRLILTMFLFSASCLAWGLWNLSFLQYPWWYATIPCALLLTVLTLGRRAALAAKASDAKYLQLQAQGRRDGSLPTVVSVSSDDTYLDDEFADYDEDFDAPYVNDSIVLPVPVTQLIPEADQRLAVINNLKDDPEFAEVNWSLKAPSFNLAG